MAAYEALMATAKDAAAKDALEPHFFSNMVIALGNHFVQRARAIEKKDGNPLKEVRMLCDSMMNHGGVMTADKTIKYDPAKSLLGYKVGEEIRLSQADFVRLASALFAMRRHHCQAPD